MNGTQEVSHVPSNGHGANGISNQAGPSNIYASPAPSSPTDASRAAPVYPAPELTADQVNQRFYQSGSVLFCCIVDPFVPGMQKYLLTYITQDSSLVNMQMCRW